MDTKEDKKKTKKTIKYGIEFFDLNFLILVSFQLEGVKLGFFNFKYLTMT